MQLSIAGSSETRTILTRQFMLTVDNDNSTCMSLPVKGQNETSPYLWLIVGLPFYGVNTSSPYQVQLTGQGIMCYSIEGPQLTKVSSLLLSLACVFRMKALKEHLTVSSLLLPLASCVI